MKECNEKIEKDKRLKKQICEYSKEHNISNMTLLRRFANPIKDLDPLAFTMMALSYKYPIMMKKEYIKKFPDHLFPENGIDSSLIDVVEKDNRRIGQVGCKKEMIEYWIKESSLPDEQSIDILDTLYKIDRNKVKEYNAIKWEDSKIYLGKQMEERKLIKMQVPLVENIRRFDTISLICKILTPHSTCSERMQRLYMENKDKLAKNIPKHISIVEQANTLRGLLDPKERYVPVLKMKYEDKYYSHSTILFSNTWQAESYLPTKEEGELSFPHAIDIENISESIIAILHKADEHTNIPCV